MRELSERQVALRRRLISDLRPVRPLRLATVYAAAFVSQIIFVLLAVFVLGIPATALQRLQEGWFVVAMALLVVAAAASAAVAARLSIPGRAVRRPVVAALALAPAVLAVAVVVVAPWGRQWLGLAEHLQEGYGCTRDILLVGFPAWIGALLLLRRLAPLEAGTIGLFACMSALLQSALLVQVMCPTGDAYHLALSHYLPILVVALGATAVSAMLLRIGFVTTPRT